MRTHAKHDRRADSGPQLTTAGLVGYLAVLAAVLALLTVPLVTVTGVVLAALTFTLLRGIDRLRRSRTTTTREPTSVVADTRTE